MLSAIITLFPDDNTLGALRGFLRDAERFAVPSNTPLIDGGHVRIAGESEPSVGQYGNDLGAVASFLTGAAGLPDDTVLEFGTDLGLDLPVFAVEPISCGEHIGSLPENVVVTVNPACGEHHD